MEVPGKRLADNDSINDTTPCCGPCLVVKDKTKASSFCIDCNEFLCSKCTKQHMMSLVSSSHKILDQNSMPNSKLNAANINLCPNDSKIATFYCELHDETICTDCQTIEHDNCRLTLIKTWALQFEKSYEYISLRNNIEGLLEQAKDTKEKLSKNRAVVIGSYSGMLTDIQTFRAEINAKLDALEFEVRNKVEDLKKRSDPQLGMQEKHLEDIEQNLIGLKACLSEQEMYMQNELLVISTKRATKRLPNTERGLNSISQELDHMLHSLHHFRRNTDLDIGIIRSLDSFGSIEPMKSTKSEQTKRKSPLVGVYDSKVDIKHYTDSQNCWITGCVEVDKYVLAIIDHNNSSVKLVGIDCNTIISHQTLPVKPWDVTRINNNKVVVTTDDRIVFLSIKMRRLAIVIEKEVIMGVLCRGIAYSNGNLFISVVGQSPAIHMLNTDGHTLETISKGIPHNYFQTPLYITTVPDTRDIIVSDHTGNTVTRIGIDGVIKATYDNKRLVGPYGVTSDGHSGVLVVGCESSNIHHLTGSCEYVGTSFDADDGIETPQAVAFCKESGRLVISHSWKGNRSNTNQLIVYKLVGENKEALTNQLQNLE